MKWSVGAIRYLCHVRSWLPSGGRARKQIMTRLQQRVRVYLEGYPRATYQSLVDRFGDPKTIAADYIGAEEPEELLNKLQVRNRVLRIVGITAALIVILWAGVVTISLIDGILQSHGHAIVYISEE